MKFKSAFSILLAVATLLALASHTSAQTARGSGQRISGAGISLTTSGSSGAATLSGAVLNIPVYGGGGSSVNIANTTSASTYYPAFSATTSGTLGTAYVSSSVWSFNPSTGMNLGNALTLSSLTTGGVVTLNGSGVVTSNANLPAANNTKGGVVLSPDGPFYTTDTASNLFPYLYTGAGGNAAPSEWTQGVVASLGTDATWQGRFQMPSLIPQGTFKLMSKCLSATSTGTALYTAQDADVGAASPSAASLTSETQSSLSITATGAYVYTKTALTSVPVADHTSVVAITFNHTGWTLAQILACKFYELWE